MSHNSVVGAGRGACPNQQSPKGAKEPENLSSSALHHLMANVDRPVVAQGDVAALDDESVYPRLEDAPEEVGEDEFPYDGISADWDDAREQGWSQHLLSVLACADLDVLTGVLELGLARF